MALCKNPLAVRYAIATLTLAWSSAALTKPVAVEATDAPEATAEDAKAAELLGRYGVTDGEVRILDGLIEQLDSDSFREREDAQRRLLSMGPKLLPYLNRVKPMRSLEQAKRVEACLKGLADQETDVFEVVWHTRMPFADLVWPKLLELYSYTDDEILRDEIIGLLIRREAGNDDVDRKLDSLLAHRDDQRRALGVLLIGYRQREKAADRLRGFLHAPSACVRLRAAQALCIYEPQACLKPLAALLTDSDPAIRVGAETLLVYLSKGDGPRFHYFEENRTNVADSWRRWAAAKTLHPSGFESVVFELSSLRAMLFACEFNTLCARLNRDELGRVVHFPLKIDGKTIVDQDNLYLELFLMLSRDSEKRTAEFQALLKNQLLGQTQPAQAKQDEGRPIVLRTNAEAGNGKERAGRRPQMVQFPPNEGTNKDMLARVIYLESDNTQTVVTRIVSRGIEPHPTPSDFPRRFGDPPKELGDFPRRKGLL